ncbi:hypothetical protein D9M68_669360 [compost metagenome]
MFTFSENNCSPKRVPPPFLLMKLLPSSALRASKPLNKLPKISLAAKGSKITVYFPGSIAFAPAEPVAFPAAILLKANTSILLESLKLCST